jgi:hypothetical protein
MRVQAGEIDVSFDDMDVLQAAFARTSTVRDEADSPVEGRLEGLLPNARRFELRRSDTGELITGRVSRGITAPESYKAFLDEQCTAHLRVITFQRPGREHRRYELLALVPQAEPVQP